MWIPRNCVDGLPSKNNHKMVGFPDSWLDIAIESVSDFTNYEDYICCMRPCWCWEPVSGWSDATDEFNCSWYLGNDEDMPVPKFATVSVCGTSLMWGEYGRRIIWSGHETHSPGINATIILNMTAGWWCGSFAWFREGWSGAPPGDSTPPGLPYVEGIAKHFYIMNNSLDTDYVAGHWMKFFPFSSSPTIGDLIGAECGWESVAQSDMGISCDEEPIEYPYCDCSTLAGGVEINVH